MILFHAHVGLLVLGLINDAHGSGFGKCPNYPSMPKFNLTRVNHSLILKFFVLKLY